MSVHLFLTAAIDPTDEIDSLIINLASTDIRTRATAMRKLTLLTTSHVDDRLFDLLRSLDCTQTSNTSNLTIVSDAIMQQLITRILLRRGERAFPALQKAVLDPYEPIQLLAIEALDWLGTDAAMTILRSVALEVSLQAQHKMIICLADPQDPRNLETLLTLLTHNASELHKQIDIAFISWFDAICEPLLPLLTHPDPSVRLCAVSSLARLSGQGNPQTIEPLKRAMHDADPQVRDKAIQALTRLQDPDATAAHVAALSSTNTQERTNAARFLAHQGDQRAVEALIAALGDMTALEENDAADIMCCHIAQALGTLQDSRALEPLLTALAGPGYAAPIGAAIGLLTLGDPRAVEPLIATLAAAYEDTQELPFNAEDLMSYENELRGGYADTKGELRERIVRTLGTLANPRAIAPLLGALDDPGAWVRDTALNALHTLASPQATDLFLTRLLEKNDANMLVLLEKIKPTILSNPHVIETMLTIITQQPWKWELAASALHTIQYPTPTTLSLCFTQSGDAQERCKAANILAKLADTRAVPLLLSVINNPDDDLSVRLAAIHALQQLDTTQRAVPLLLSIINNPDDDLLVRLAAIHALQQSDTIQLCESLLPLFKNTAEPLQLRITALETFSIGQNSPALDVLIAVVHDEQEGLPLRIAALTLLSHHTKENACAVLSTLLSSNVPTELRIKALQDLTVHCQFYRPQNLQPFLTALQDKEQDIRVAAARALGQLGAWCAASDEQDVLSAIPALHAMERYEIETDADPHAFLATQKTLNALLSPDHSMASNGEGDLPEDAATEAIRWIRSKR